MKLLTLAFLALLPSAASGATSGWKAASDRVVAARDEVDARFEALLPRVREACAARPDLLKKLDREPPSKLASGWGLLPPIDADEVPPATSGPAGDEARYSLAELRSWPPREMRRLDEAESALRTGDL